MSRALHTQDICTVSDKSLQAEIEAAVVGNTCVIAAEDSRLNPLVPIKGQQTLRDTRLSLPTGTTLCTAPIYQSTREQGSYLPHTSSEQFHFETNQFDSVVFLLPMCGYFQRAAPFLDATRLVKRGGMLVSVTGLRLANPSDHDAKWWVPDSDDVETSEIRIVRTEEYKTPIVISIFTVTSDKTRNPSGKLVTGSKNTTQVE